MVAWYWQMKYASVRFTWFYYYFQYLTVIVCTNEISEIDFINKSAYFFIGKCLNIDDFLAYLTTVWKSCFADQRSQWKLIKLFDLSLFFFHFSVLTHSHCVCVCPESIFVHSFQTIIWFTEIDWTILALVRHVVTRTKLSGN